MNGWIGTFGVAILNVGSCPLPVPCLEVILDSTPAHRRGDTRSARHSTLTAILRPFVGFPANIGSRLVAPRSEVRPAELQSRCGGQADRRRARECRFAHSSASSRANSGPVARAIGRIARVWPYGTSRKV